MKIATTRIRGTPEVKASGTFPVSRNVYSTTTVCAETCVTTLPRCHGVATWRTAMGVAANDRVKFEVLVLMKVSNADVAQTGTKGEQTDCKN